MSDIDMAESLNDFFVNIGSSVEEQKFLNPKHVILHISSNQIIKVFF